MIKRIHIAFLFLALYVAIMLWAGFKIHNLAIYDLFNQLGHCLFNAFAVIICLLLPVTTLHKICLYLCVLLLALNMYELGDELARMNDTPYFMDYANLFIALLVAIAIVMPKIKQ